jgi:hypothetical protein
MGTKPEMEGKRRANISRPVGCIPAFNASVDRQVEVTKTEIPVTAEMSKPKHSGELQ